MRADQVSFNDTAAWPGPPRVGLGSGENIFSPSSLPPTAGAGRLKIFALNGKEWLWVAEWVWGRTGRVNLYSRQMVVLPRKTTTYATHSSPGPSSGSPCPGNLYRLSSHLFGTATDKKIYLNINQLDALNFIVSLLHASTCFEHKCSSSGGQNCIIQPLVSSHL